MHLSLGTIYTFGNLLPYVVSYIRERSHPRDLTSEMGAWIFALNLVGQGGSMFLGGWLERKIGPRLTTLIGGWIMSIGVVLSYFAIKVSFWLLLLTYGLVFGIGVGIAYVGPLSCAMRWLPRWKGVAGGFVVAGFGLGALIFDQVQSNYINPRNLKPTDGYFTEKDLLDRVPFVFLILGGSYAIMQFVGSMLIVNPPHSMEPEVSKDEQKKNHQESAKDLYKAYNGSRETKRRKFTDSNNHDDFFTRISDGSVTPPTQEFMSDAEASYSSSSDEEVNETAAMLAKKELDLQQKQLSNNTSAKSNSVPPSPSKPAFVHSESAGVVVGVHPLRVLRTIQFYHLWVMMLLAGFTVSFIATLFKVFGLSFIHDDQFLAVVGSTSAILNCTGRIVWGIVADRVSYKFALVLQSGIMTVFMLTFFATSAVGKPMFFIWVCIIFFCVGGVFSLYPTAIALNFGPKYMSINYGLLFTSQISSGVMAALLFSTLQSSLDWDGTIFLVSGVSLAGFLITLGFRSRPYRS